MDTKMDKFAMYAFFAMVIGVSAWWFGSVIPERDRKLKVVHACYIDSGCSGLGIPGQDQAASQCWADCTTEAARSEGFATVDGVNR